MLYISVMKVRSLQASLEGIEKARKTLTYYYLSEKELAEKELKVSHQVVDNFFRGEPVDSEYFYQICSRLNLEWEEIVTKPPSESEPESSAKQDTSIDIDALVQEVRSKSRASIVMQLSPLGESLPSLINQLPDLERDQERFKQWWQANGGVWTEQLRAVMISHRDIGHAWQFSDQQREALGQYYEANQLLVDCLESNCYLTRAVREGLEETSFLPAAEIR